MKKQLRFNPKIFIYLNKDQMPYTAEPGIHKKNMYDLYDVKYSRELMKKYDQIQRHVLIILLSKLKSDVVFVPEKDICPLKITREDIFWINDNSPISFMKYIIEKEEHFSHFYKNLLHFIKTKMKIGDVKKIRFLYGHYVITISSIKRIN